MPFGACHRHVALRGTGRLGCQTACVPLPRPRKTSVRPAPTVPSTPWDGLRYGHALDIVKAQVIQSVEHDMRKVRIPNIGTLLAFEAAARYESFTLAARDLCLTESAISRDRPAGRQIDACARQAACASDARGAALRDPGSPLDRGP